MLRQQVLAGALVLLALALPTPSTAAPPINAPFQFCNSGIEVRLDSQGNPTSVYETPLPYALAGHVLAAAGGYVSFCIYGDRALAGSISFAAPAPLALASKSFTVHPSSFGPAIVRFGPVTAAGGIFPFTVRFGAATASDRVEVIRDLQPPSCGIFGSVVPGEFSTLSLVAQDSESGLSLILPVDARNLIFLSGFDFTPGTTDPVFIDAQKAAEGFPARVTFQVYDMVGNEAICDPIFTDVVKSSGVLATETFTQIPAAEHLIEVANGRPGLRDLEIRMNGRKFKLSGLRDGEKRSLDVSSAMLPGDENVLNLNGKGRPGARAAVMVWDGGSGAP